MVVSRKKKVIKLNSDGREILSRFPWFVSESDRRIRSNFSYIDDEGNITRGMDSFPIENYPPSINRINKKSDEFLIELEKFCKKLNREWKLKKKKTIKLNSHNRNHVEPFPWYVTGESIRASFYYLDEEGNKKKGYDRYPKWAYKHIVEEHKNNPVLLNEELTRLCHQLNQKRMDRAWLAKNALGQILKKSPYVNKALIDSFYKFLADKIPNKKDLNYQYNILNDRVLKFFIQNLELSNPKDWNKYEFDWGKSLMNIDMPEKHRIWEKEDFRPSVKTLKRIIQVANRFLKFYHGRELEASDRKLVVLEPISYAVLESYKASMVKEKKHKKKEDYKNFMSEENFETLIKHLQSGKVKSSYCASDDITAYVKLCYFYGLRRNESMALDLNCLRKNCLVVSEQAVKLTKYFTGYETKHLKGKEISRKVPHWMISADEAYEILSLYKAKGSRPFHPDTFTAKFKEAIDEINQKRGFVNGLGKPTKINFTIHDLRRTFITRCFLLRDEDKKPLVTPFQIQLAVGHKSINTTMLYQVDPRGLDDDEPYIPPYLKSVG